MGASHSTCRTNGRRLRDIVCAGEACREEVGGGGALVLSTARTSRCRRGCVWRGGRRIRQFRRDGRLRSLASPVGERAHGGLCGGDHTLSAAAAAPLKAQSRAPWTTEGLLWRAVATTAAAAVVADAAGAGFGAPGPSTPTVREARGATAAAATSNHSHARARLPRGHVSSDRPGGRGARGTTSRCGRARAPRRVRDRDSAGGFPSHRDGAAPGTGHRSSTGRRARLLPGNVRGGDAMGPHPQMGYAHFRRLGPRRRRPPAAGEPRTAFKPQCPTERRASRRREPTHDQPVDSSVHGTLACT